MKPVLKINGNDYTAFLAQDGLSPVREDLDADGSGRNLLDGLMYRARVAQKDKWAVKFLPLPELIMKSLAEDIDGEYTAVTILNPKLNRVVTQNFYISSLNYGTQRYRKDDDSTYYVGCTFNMTER